MTHADRNTFPYTLIPHSAPIADLSAGELDAYARRYTVVGDPPADALVASFRDMRPAGAGRALFERALTHGIDSLSDPPSELTVFFRSFDGPTWADTDQLDLAARVIGRTGTIGITALTATLLGGYLAPRPTKPLTRTGDLERMAPRRLAETIHWFVAVTRPGGLRRAAPGWQATVRVRLMHAMVRAAMVRRPDWNWDAWDFPLNASQTAGTNALFAGALLTGTEALGLRHTVAETAAVCHMWSVIGYLLGVPPELLPYDAHDLARVLRIQGQYEFNGADRDSVRLAQALIEAVGRLTIGASEDLPRRIAASALCTYSRRLLGTENANYLGLPDRPLLQRGLDGAAAAIARLESARRMVPGATHVAERCGRRRWETTAQRVTAQHFGDARFDRHDIPTGPAPGTPPITQNAAPTVAVSAADTGEVR